MIELAPRPTPTDPLPFVPPVPVVQVHDGVRLVAVDVPGDGFVDVRLLWSRGWAHEPDELDGITELTARLVGNATEELDPYALACAAESIGASLRASVGSESFTLAVDVVRDGLEPAVDLLLDSLRRPDLSDAHVDRVRTEAVDARRRHLADPVRLADEVLSRHIHPGVRAGRPHSGSRSALQARTTAQIQTHVRGTLHGQCPTALVTGDLATLDIAAIGQRVATAFAHARPAPAPRFTTPQTDPTRSVVLVDRPRAVQSVLAIGHLAPSRHHPDHTALYLGVGLLGGAFHSRLNLQLREERGYTYGARAQHLARRDVGALVLRTSVAAAATAPSLADVDTVVSRLLVYGATREEVDATRDARVRRSPQRFETVRSTGDAVAGLLALGIEPHDVGAFEAELPHIQLRDVDEALRHHLRPEAMTAVVVGPADRIRGEVERLDLGRLVVVRDRPD